MWKKVLIGCGGLLACVVIAFVALGVWLIQKNNAADSAGRAFCNSVQPGMDAAAVEALAQRDAAHPSVWRHETDFEVRYFGAFLHNATCRMTVVDGRIDTRALIFLDD
jgi:hypothetical protein